MFHIRPKPGSSGKPIIEPRSSWRSDYTPPRPTCSVVLDPPPETSIFSTELQEELRAIEGKAALHYLVDLPTQDVIAKLNAAPPTSILLYVRQARDLAGHRVASTDALKLIADDVNMPTYGAYDAYLGAGIIGGYVFSSPANGARVGDMALRVANGANIENIPIERALTVPQFDWRQLQRWHIRDSQLPAGSVVLFRQFTFWDQYKRYIVAAASLFAIQLALTGDCSFSGLAAAGRNMPGKRAKNDTGRS